MRRLLLLLTFGPFLLPAYAGWVKFASGPFEVLTNANPRAARETLADLEQFRNALGGVIGEQDPATPEPVRIFIPDNAKGWSVSGALVRGRNFQALVIGGKTGISPETYRALARLFLESGGGLMPAAFERGLIEFFSTFKADGTHITAGAPPPKPDLDWARVHLLIVDPEYYGKLRVLLYNLRKGVAEDAAYRNAFGKTPAEVETAAKARLAAGNFQTTALSGRPLSPADFSERAVSEADARLARADLLQGPESAAEYRALLRESLKLAEANEGLGLLALRDGRKDEARKFFAAAMEAGTPSARCYIEYARLEPDDARAEQALLKAAGINPKLDEPFALLAERDTDPRKRIAHWQAAAERNPRNTAYWKALAESCLAANDFAGAAKAWTSGEQAATDAAVRREMHAGRLATDERRLDYEAAEKKRKADEEAAELDKLKAEARAEVHEIERKYNEGAAPQARPDAVPWWDAPKAPGTVTGTLRRVDCLGAQARISVETAEGKTVNLLVTEPDKVAINGAGEFTLACGAQKPRRVAVQYFPKANARLGTAGEVASIEIQ